MASSTVKFLFALCLAISSQMIASQNAQNAQNANENYLDIEAPTIFNYNSPLKQPDSLRSRPYFDFLSTLYRHDTTKSDLFRPYLQRTRRDVVAAAEIPQQVAPSPVAQSVASAANVVAQPEIRRKRAILFRPLFVYKQQQVRRQEAAKRRRRVRV